MPGLFFVPRALALPYRSGGIAQDKGKSVTGEMQRMKKFFWISALCVGLSAAALFAAPVGAA